MRVVIVIVSWEGAAVLPACLEALGTQLGADAELLVVDNGSTDHSAACVRQSCPQARLIQNERNLGFGGGVNVALRALRQAMPPDVVVLLNQDTVVAPGWLAALLTPFDEPAIGAVGCKLLYPDGTIQHAGAYLDYPRALAHHIGWHEVDDGQYDIVAEREYVTGASLALRWSVLQQVGFLDDGYNPGYYEDSDLLWRLRRVGYRVMYAGHACALHQESTSIPDQVRRGMLYNRNRLRFVLKTYSSSAFRQDFVPAERAFVAQHGQGDEARALRWAYLHALVTLPDTLWARQSLQPDDPLPQAEVGRTLVSLRRWIGECERSRIAGRL